MLRVSPSFQHNGIGNVVLRHIEKQLIEAGYDSVRLDVFTQNPYALRLYEKNGYVKRGFADWRKGRFLLMEKKLDRSMDLIFLAEADVQYADELEKFKDELYDCDVPHEVYKTPHGYAVIADHGFDTREILKDRDYITLKRDDMLCWKWKQNLT